jgi:hypothetical protein
VRSMLRGSIVLGLILWGCQSPESSETGDAQAAIDQSRIRDAQAAVDQSETRDAPAATSQVDLGQPDLGRTDLGRDASAPPEVESPDAARDRASADAPPIAPVGNDAASMDSLKADGGGDVVSDSGSSPAQVTMRKAAAWVDCMPSTRPDPVVVMWTVDVSGARGKTVKVTSATITVSNGTSSIVENITVDKPTIALVDGAGSAEQRKPVGSGPSEDNQACLLMCKGATYRLDLTFDNEGQTFSTSASGSVSCSY